MCPLWSGLITNTLVWATVLWVLTLGPFELRRAVRLGGGRCLSCGYALRGGYAAGCPECGWQRPVR